MQQRAYLALALGLFMAVPALAGPGGVFKNPVVWWILLLLLPILLPLVIITMIKEKRQIKQTQADLARLADVFPQYQWLMLRDRAQDAFTWMWSEWSQGKLEKSKQFVTDWYWENQQLLLAEWEHKGWENVCDLNKIQSIEPYFVAHATEAENAVGSRVVVRIRAEVWDFLREKATSKIIKGEDKIDSLETLWTFLWTGDAWMLNRIESGSLSLEYTKIANIVPEVLNAPQRAYNKAE
ncbi:hypothetical protein [Armatimonas sp.]|uniref:hypothetical protein n=1 Tax=Armatimonas sp. TaxID=1872638 RepID=UPI00374D7443